MAKLEFESLGDFVIGLQVHLAILGCRLGFSREDALLVLAWRVSCASGGTSGGKALAAVAASSQVWQRSSWAPTRQKSCLTRLLYVLRGIPPVFRLASRFNADLLNRLWALKGMVVLHGYSLAVCV